MKKQIITITAKRKLIKTHLLKTRQGKPFRLALLHIYCTNTGA